jgi:hypothetical protein
MKSKQILFFGTSKDLLPIIKDVENRFPIKYFEMGLFDDNKSREYSSIDKVQNFGKPQFGDWNWDIRLMMMPKDSNLVIREVPQRKGGIKYAIDPFKNQTSICFQFGGIVKEGVLLAGTCGTVFLNDFSLNIFKMFSLALKKNFKRIGNFYVGNMAEEKLKAGWRLVTNEKSPKEYDLTTG